MAMCCADTYAKGRISCEIPKTHVKKFRMEYWFNANNSSERDNKGPSIRVVIM